MLKVKNLHSYYGKSHILQGINLSIDEGEIVSLLGRNGVGRSTFIKSIMGMVKSEGSILFKIPIENAPVLPVPDCACAIKSFLVFIKCSDLDWIFDGCSNPY